MDFLCTSIACLADIAVDAREVREVEFERSELSRLSWVLICKRDMGEIGLPWRWLMIIFGRVDHHSTVTVGQPRFVEPNKKAKKWFPFHSRSSNARASWKPWRRTIFVPKVPVHPERK